MANAIRTTRKRYANMVAQEWNFRRWERPRSVRADSEFGFSQHIRAATSKANSMIGLLKNAFVCRDVELLKKLYLSRLKHYKLGITKR